MIKYTLKCGAGHSFESWFRDSGSFDHLAAANLVACPTCGSPKVEKALMAPAVRTRRSRDPSPDKQVGSDVPIVAAADTESHGAKLRAMVHELRAHLLKHSTDVGATFAEEARKIHDGESEEKPIHGTASRDEVRALVEDGIEILPIPVLPDERH